MPAEISSETKANFNSSITFQLAGKNLRIPEIDRKKCFSSSSVHRVLKKHDEEKSGVSPRVKRLPAHQRPYKCTKFLIRKVAKAAFVKALRLKLLWPELQGVPGNVPKGHEATASPTDKKAKTPQLDGKAEGTAGSLGEIVYQVLIETQIAAYGFHG